MILFRILVTSSLVSSKKTRPALVRWLFTLRSPRKLIIGDTGTMTAEMIRRARAVSARADGVEMSFEESMLAQNVSLSDLPLIYRRLRLSALVVAFLGTVSIVFGVARVFLTPDISAVQIITILIQYVIGSALVLSGFTSAFRCWQIRSYRLGPVSEFVSKPDGWWPEAWPPQAPPKVVVSGPRRDALKRPAKKIVKK